MILQRVNLRAHRRLADAEPLRRATEVAIARGSHEHLQATEGYGHDEPCRRVAPRPDRAAGAALAGAGRGGGETLTCRKNCNIGAAAGRRARGPVTITRFAGCSGGP